MTGEPEHCPQGHDLKWPNGNRSYRACQDCPANVDGKGHFTTWCEQCRKRYFPPGCRSAD